MFAGTLSDQSKTYAGSALDGDEVTQNLISNSPSFLGRELGYGYQRTELST